MRLAKAMPETQAGGVDVGISGQYRLNQTPSGRTKTIKKEPGGREKMGRFFKQRARPILESIKSQIQAARSQTLPKSALAKACNYTLTLWNRLTCFLNHPTLELSTNAAENAIRPVALGRKNWIHFGSQQAGPRIAAILSIVETCRRLQISIRDYLARYWALESHSFWLIHSVEINGRPSALRSCSRRFLPL
jgi:Transposase IS66 family